MQTNPPASAELLAWFWVVAMLVGLVVGAVIIMLRRRR